MERDSRRDRGQWKGCYSFKDITCDDDSGVGPSRQGGLKMGNTYHYFYELDGTHETHDPARPSTRHCAYMPGQTVNTLFVPIQQTLRKRSASLSSMRTGDFMTMNPSDKYTTPRPAPRSPLSNLTTAAPSAVPTRLGSSPHLLRHRSSARSLSPSPSWKRFFRRPHAAEQQQQRAATPELLPPSEDDDARSVRSHVSAAGSGSRSRDISPESLRRFLVDDSPPSPVGEWPSVVIPEDIAEEEEEAEIVEDVDDDEDDNFATAAAVELDDDAASSASSYPTGLAPPPPFRRTASSPAPAVTSWFGAPPPLPSSRAPSPLAAVDDESPVLPDFENRSHFSFSSASSCASSVGAAADDAETPPVYDYDYLNRTGEVEERVTSAGYGLPGSAGSKAGGEGRLLQEELAWMVDIIKS
ncbi:uncharacterized protein DNG_07206 [Cephalotrichum gorgonifer]|uniref:Uncharacterized protein n=1 Tax=Cephalotrichum gorgonifer TaxID=2041049 RepID=A0AAE8N154_9PEZI|nr:uncharacterized protein DNG_07206 [Cephalotrichum gorgonifer]